MHLGVLELVDYCLTYDVKVVLHIDLEETSDDAELDSYVTVGCVLVDGLLRERLSHVWRRF